MAGVTNRGKKVILNAYFTADTTDEPAAFKLLLVTSAVAPDADQSVLSGLTEVANGNGYTTGGEAVARAAGAGGFDVITQVDASDHALIQLDDVVWTASSGPIPVSGDPPRWACLMDDAATPNVIAFFDLVSDRTVSDTQTLTLQNCEIRFNET